MIYRVTISQTYLGVHFDFDDFNEANKFALLVLNHGRCDKNDYTSSVTIRVMKEDEDDE